ncbi:MAG: DoxX family protein [Winogradskyella arenosi]
MHSKTSYLIVRLALGLSMFGHGLVRLPKLEAFSQGLVKSFENSMMPEVLTLPFSYILPFGELIFGALLVIGLFTRVAVLGIAAILLALIFGSTLVENWGAITAQLVHVAFVAYLSHHIKDNSYALDRFVYKN